MARNSRSKTGSVRVEESREGVDGSVDRLGCGWVGLRVEGGEFFSLKFLYILTGADEIPFFVFPLQMLGLIGTVILLLPSPYFRPLLNATQSSCLLRRTTTFISLLVLGPSPTSSLTSSPSRDTSTTDIFSWAWNQAKSDEEDASKKLNKSSTTATATRGRSNSIKEVLWAGLTAAVPKQLAATKEEREEEEERKQDQEWQEEPVQFKFEVMENQRWWLALDWTTTLAPSDRPVW